MAVVPGWGGEWQSVGHNARVPQLGGGLSITEAVGSGLRPLREEAISEWSQAAEGRRHGWEDKKQ